MVLTSGPWVGFVVRTLILVSVAALCGCVRVPPTKIDVPLPNGAVARLRAPKDAEVEGLSVDLVNGTLKLDRYRARNNPEVIGATAQGQLELLRAYTEILNAGLALVLKAYGLPLPAPSPTPLPVVPGRPPAGTNVLSGAQSFGPRFSWESAAAQNPSDASIAGYAE